MVTRVDEVNSTFCSLLRTRLERGVLTTEDSIRYTFFAALMRSGGLNPEDLVLEYPHPVIQRAKIDTWAVSLEGRPLAVEFKYDRPLPGGKNTPRTQRAGNVFNDIRRLALVAGNRNARCLLIYVATEEMSSYFANPANGLDGFFGIRMHSTLDIDANFFSAKAQSFIAAAGNGFNASVTMKLSETLPQSHELRIYEIFAPRNSE